MIWKYFRGKKSIPHEAALQRLDHHGLRMVARAVAQLPERVLSEREQLPVVCAQTVRPTITESQRKREREYSPLY
jgi:hypothetical protein